MWKTPLSGLYLQCSGVRGSTLGRKQATAVTNPVNIIISERRAVLHWVFGVCIEVYAWNWASKIAHWFSWKICENLFIRFPNMSLTHMGTPLSTDNIEKLCIQTAKRIILQNVQVWSLCHVRAIRKISLTLQWRHNGRDVVSNNQPHDCLLNRLLGRRTKKTPKLRVTGLRAGNSPVSGEFLSQMASDAENFSISWRHHENLPPYFGWLHITFTIWRR